MKTGLVLEGGAIREVCSQPAFLIFLTITILRLMELLGIRRDHTRSEFCLRTEGKKHKIHA